jgi:uncharacterized protein YdhG (YjbR/CyaY superfamily)
VTAKPTDIDGYLATVPDDARATLEELRRAIKAAAPDAAEGIGYGMPSFKYRGRPLIYIGAAKNHCAIYGPAVDAHREALAGYDASKGTIRFPPGAPPPESLVRMLVSARMADIDATLEAAAARKRKAPGATPAE